MSTEFKTVAIHKDLYILAFVSSLIWFKYYLSIIEQYIVHIWPIYNGQNICGEKTNTKIADLLHLLWASGHNDFIFIIYFN